MHCSTSRLSAILLVPCALVSCQTTGDASLPYPDGCTCPDPTLPDALSPDSAAEASWEPLTCDNYYPEQSDRRSFSLGMYYPAGISVSTDQRYVYYRIDYFAPVEYPFLGVSYSLLYRVDLEALSPEFVTYWHRGVGLSCQSYQLPFIHSLPLYNSAHLFYQCRTVAGGRFRIVLRPTAGCPDACGGGISEPPCTVPPEADPWDIGELTDAERRVTLRLRVFFPERVSPWDDPPCSWAGMLCRPCAYDSQCYGQCSGEGEDGQRYCIP